jgi:hypothetical protein
MRFAFQDSCRWGSVWDKTRVPCEKRNASVPVDGLGDSCASCAGRYRIQGFNVVGGITFQVAVT